MQRLRIYCIRKMNWVTSKRSVLRCIRKYRWIWLALMGVLCLIYINFVAQWIIKVREIFGDFLKISKLPCINSCIFSSPSLPVGLSVYLPFCQKVCLSHSRILLLSVKIHARKLKVHRKHAARNQPNFIITLSLSIS